jgi:intracellular sulfur oxidation DsrE/DsrF family protein
MESKEMKIRGLFTVLALAAALLSASITQVPHAAWAAGGVHKLAIHVDDSDPKRMNLALNNAENVTKYFESKGETVIIEIVTYGPGLHMLRSDTSPVKARVEAMSLGMENLSFAACGNTMAKMATWRTSPSLPAATPWPRWPRKRATIFRSCPRPSR